MSGERVGAQNENFRFFLCLISARNWLNCYRLSFVALHIGTAARTVGTFASVFSVCLITASAFITYLFSYLIVKPVVCKVRKVINKCKSQLNRHFDLLTYSANQPILNCCFDSSSSPHDFSIFSNIRWHFYQLQRSHCIVERWTTEFCYVLLVHFDANKTEWRNGTVLICQLQKGYWKIFHRKRKNGKKRWTKMKQTQRYFVIVRKKWGTVEYNN